MATPTYLGLKAFLASRGLGCSDLKDVDFKKAVANAITKFEIDTEWHPFVPAASTPTTLTLSGPEGRMIFPPVGIISLASLTMDGHVQVVNTNYRLGNRFLPNQGPYTSIELDLYWSGAWGISVLSGVFGYALEWPALAEEAIYSKVAHDLYSFITGVDGDLKREKQGPVEFEYQQGKDSEYQGKRGQLLKAYDDAISHYHWVRL